MSRNIDVAKLLASYELVDLNQVKALHKGLTEMTDRRTKAAIDEFEQKLKMLKSGEVPAEALNAPAPKKRNRKKKGEEDGQAIQDAEFEN